VRSHASSFTKEINGVEFVSTETQIRSQKAEYVYEIDELPF